MNLKKKWLEILAIVLAIIIVLVPNFIAPVCGPKPDGSHMGCFYSAKFVIKQAIVIIIVTLIMIFSEKSNYAKIIKIVGSIVNVIIGFLIYAVPHKIVLINNEMGRPYGFCGKETMACITNHTFEIAGILGLIIAIIMLVVLTKIFLIKKK